MLVTIPKRAVLRTENELTDTLNPCSLLLLDETDQEVVRLREMFESILVKYLWYNYKKFSKINEMKNVKIIVDQLENLSKTVE